MYIHEAATKAFEDGKYITRRPSDPETCWAYTKLEPTNGVECVIVHNSKFRHQAPTPRWQPRAEDLIAGDWEVVD